jgi:hypothetical protein
MAVRRGEQTGSASRLGLSVDPPAEPTPRAPVPPASSPGRRAAPWVAGIVALACAGGLYFAYRHVGPEVAGSGDIPIIRADQGAVKVRPQNPGGDAAPSEDNGVYTTDQPNNATEHLLPPPETPMPKPAPTMTAPPPPEAENSPAPGPKPQQIPQIAAVAPPPAAAKPAPAVPAPVQPAVPKPPPQVAQVPPPLPPSSGGPAQYRVQVAATKDEDSAHAEWSRLQTAHPDLLGSLPVTVVRVDLGDRGIFFRLQAGAFDDRAGADKLCADLKAISIACLTVRAH